MSSEANSVGLFKNKGFVSLDALRAIAAISVAIPHYFLFQGQASATLEFISIIAVEVFFALSGFVLARQLIFCIETPSWRNLSVFYARRWMRTLPPYLIVLFFLSVATQQLFSKDFWQYAVFIRNFIEVRAPGDYFTVAWSLAVEEWFYLLFPIFIIFLTRARLSILAAALVFAFALFAAKIAYLLYAPELFDHARRIVILRLDSIAFGFILAILAPKIQANRQRAWLPLISIAITTLVLSIYAANQSLVLIYVYAAPLFAVALIAILLLAEDSIAHLPVVPKLASFGANTSYMIYLVHTLLIVKLTSLHGVVSEPVHFIIYLAMLLAICALFFLAIEAPILRARPRYTSASPTNVRNELISSPALPWRAGTALLTNLIAALAFAALIEGGA